LPTRRAAEWRLAFASLASMLLVLAASEAALRARGPARVDGLLSLHRYSEAYGWEPRPGVHVMQSGKTVTVNPGGYRGPVARRHPDGREARVLLLGDSIAFGLEVGDQETFAHRLGLEDGFEVVNLAVDGYGPDQSLLKLEREGLAFRPDVVVMNFCLENDFADAVSATFLYDGLHPKPYFRLGGRGLELHDEHLKLGFRERLGLAVRDSSRLVAGLASALDRRRAPPAHWLDRREALLRDPQAEDLTLALLARMRDRAQDAGAEFVVALHPGRDSLRRRSRWTKALAASPLLQATPVLEMREAYLARGLKGEDLVMDHVGHLTPAGHRAAAEVLAAALRGERLDTRRAREHADLPSTVG
jgi:hypothetical protein